ncbi:AraC family ligand binding domain-containing protein [Curtobacterium sp. GD1]|uniref:AraC family ligand binding domain-containing protein n=1 Tax=Curtobacterium sp. GD1 TaxID=2810612 RepID=UPI001E2E776F|nr:AraC family ligand binding domain-containing protein [Curtobacterium sp. GD1]MCC8907848.1 AraC family ligand binding domain-containing protein [Curtobacterium sp. GD1]
MRNVSVADFDGLPVDVLPIGTDYPPDHLLARHEHRRAQLLYGASGVMLVETDEGSWTVPTDRAVLIPAGVAHEVRMLDVTTWSLYVEPDAVPWWPTVCTVVEVGPLLREVLRAANALEIPTTRPVGTGRSSGSPCTSCSGWRRSRSPCPCHRTGSSASCAVPTWQHRTST